MVVVYRFHVKSCYKPVWSNIEKEEVWTDNFFYPTQEKAQEALEKEIAATISPNVTRVNGWVEELTLPLEIPLKGIITEAAFDSMDLLVGDKSILDTLEQYKGMHAEVIVKIYGNTNKDVNA